MHGKRRNSSCMTTPAGVWMLLLASKRPLPVLLPCRLVNRAWNCQQCNRCSIGCRARPPSLSLPRPLPCAWSPSRPLARDALRGGWGCGSANPLKTRYRAEKTSSNKVHKSLMHTRVIFSCCAACIGPGFRVALPPLLVRRLFLTCIPP